jgi:hypothetical protein
MVGHREARTLFEQIDDRLGHHARDGRWLAEAVRVHYHTA